MSHAKTKGHRVAKHATFSMAMFGHGGNLLAMAGVLGVHSNNVLDVVQRHNVLDDGGCLDVIWAPLTKEFKSDKLEKDVANVVTQ